MSSNRIFGSLSVVPSFYNRSTIIKTPGEQGLSASATNEHGKSRDPSD
jgi:hypothetical protein